MLLLRHNAQKSPVNGSDLSLFFDLINNFLLFFVSFQTYTAYNRPGPNHHLQKLVINKCLVLMFGVHGKFLRVMSPYLKAISMNQPKLLLYGYAK